VCNALGISESNQRSLLHAAARGCGVRGQLAGQLPGAGLWPSCPSGALLVVGGDETSDANPDLWSAAIDIRTCPAAHGEVK
jgi:hypothetical protein